MHVYKSVLLQLANLLLRFVITLYGYVTLEKCWIGFCYCPFGSKFGNFAVIQIWITDKNWIKTNFCKNNRIIYMTFQV